MAGSSTQSVENFTAQGMERHQIMMNTDVMKHFRIINKASVREIMLQHEKTFKEQVHDLHKLYEVQRSLMDKSKSTGLDVYLGVPPPSPGCGGNALSEETNQFGQRRNFREQVTPNGLGGVSAHHLLSTQNAASEKNIKWEDTLKSVNSPVRKRKIDLEQLPEDDSDDEMENSLDALNPTSSSLSGNSRELTKGHSGLESMMRLHPSSSVGTGFQPLQKPINDSQVRSLLTAESSLHKSRVDGNRADSCIPLQHGKAPNLAVNVVKVEQNLTNLVERNMSLQSASTLNTVTDTIKSNSVFLPQADLIDRASQDAGREAHWFFQASEANTPNRFPLQSQQRLSPHLALPERSSTSRSQLHNGILQGSPNSEQRHPNSKSPPLESVSSIVGDWNKAPVEQQSPGLLVGAQKDRSFGSSERLGDASRWFTNERLSQGPLASAAPMARFETRASEGGHAMPGIVAPGIVVANNKGSSQERDMNIWSSQNPVLQIPQYQQPSVFQPQVFPSVNPAVWLQSSQNTQNSLYSQQVVYGIHPSDASQIGYRAESLQRNQGDVASPWNMIGLGHYYSSVPPTPQKRPFKKPPKLVLKNDGVGMELKLVSPEKETSEKASQKKPLNPFKKDSSQDSSKSCERKSGAQKEVKEEDNKHEKRVKSAVEILNSAGQGGEPLRTQGDKSPRTVSVSLESRHLAPATFLLSQEIISPKESTLPQNAAATVTVPAVSQCNVGAVASTTHCVIGAGRVVSASPDELINQQCASQAEAVLPSRDQEKIAEQSLPDLESSQAACAKKTLPWTNAGMEKDMQGEKSESISLQCKDDMGAGCCIVKDLKPLSARELSSEGNADDVVATGQSKSFDATPQYAQSKSPEESVISANTWQQQAHKSASHCHELGQPKDSQLPPCATASSPSKEASQSRGLSQGRPLGHSADLTIPSSQPVTQAISMQSTSTDTPNNIKQDKKRSSKVVENSTSHKVTGKRSSACKGESANPTSERDALSLTSLASESRPEAMAGVSSEDLHHDSDSDNLAATILLSFAPKIDVQNEEKHSKGKVGVISGSGLKDRPLDQVLSKTSRSAEGAPGLQSEGSLGRQIQGQGSFKRTDRNDHHVPKKPTMKDKLRREERKSAELQGDNGGEDVTKSIMIKLPRMVGTLNDEAIPISRSKQLNKLNRATLSGETGEHTKSFKSNDAFHAPTGRRSSRGPPMAARVSHESRARLHQQTQHRVEGNPTVTDKDSGSREEGGVARNKLEGNRKSKAWGELNRTRSHPHKQLQETSHRKTQK
eukprot:c19766_g1_i1 orf=313-4149(+)